ncbi:hypothetical protein VZT92_022235 [Zoarces viviparus]|uniref:Uncharacterized protein n=1 Tax=Zoarces viviparus TaxID=48416 RepID=A0AAW1EAU9_ZOAVI
MFCPDCGNQVESSYKFCPQCGFKLFVLTQNRTQDVASSAHQPSDAAEEENQKEAQDQVPKDVKEEQENLAQIKDQPASDEQEAARDGATPQDPSDNAAGPAALEKRASSPNLTTRKTQVSETCKEEGRPSATAPESNSQPCSEVAPGVVSDYTTPPSSTPASDNLAEQQTEAPPDSSTEDRLDAVQIPADKPSDIHSGLLSNSVSSLTSPQETGSTAPESSEETPQDCDMVAKQSVSEQDKEKTIFHETQNLSGRPDEKDQAASDDQEAARDGATPQDPSDNAAGPAALEKRASSPNQTLSVQIPADKPSGIHSGPLSNSVSSLTSLKETGSTAPESSEVTPQDWVMVEKQSVSEQDKEKTIFHETQNLSGRSDEKAVDTKSKAKTNTRLAAIQEQQPGNRDVYVSTSPEHSSPLIQNISETSTQVQAQQTFPSSEYMPVYFHAVTSKDFHLDPEKDLVYLRSERIFGHWDAPGLKMSFSRSLGDKSYLVDGQVMIHRNLIHESIPYKYVIVKYIENEYKGMYETIYQKDGNQFVNRCLKIKEDFLTHEGEWHQYDDVIHRELKKKFASWISSIEDIVLKRRDQAGRVMLSIIFDLPTTWNKPNLDNFFLLLQQFFYAYSNPVLHDGTERPWGIPYNREQVKNLLKRFLEENIIHNPKKQKGTTKSISPLRAGVVSLLIYNKYLEDDMTNQLSNLCDHLRLPKKPQHHFLHFWKDFASPLSDKKSVADAVEILCNKARQHQIEKWILIIPLIHLLRGDSKPFEPVPPVSNPQFDSCSGLMGSKGTHFNRDNYARGAWMMKEHAYLMDIDRLLVHSWMSLVPVDYLTSFITNVKVELLDILHHMQFSIKSGLTHSNYKALEELARYLIDRESHRSKSFDDKYKECCLKTAVRLLGSICHHTTDPGLCDVPVYFLDLVCLIANACDHTDSQSRDRSQESILEALETMRQWRRNTFRNKLLNEWDRTQFSVLHEIKVWDKLVSVSFNHQEHTSQWRTPFLQDFEGKLKQERPEDQIGMYSNKMEELSRTSPLLCNTMEKCAVDAIAAICQNKSGRAASALLEKHDITKFGKLMSAVVLNTWPTDASGAYIEGEDFIFEYLLNWPMAKTFFQMTGAGGRLIEKLSDEVQIRMTLASSAFKSVSEKFFSGEIQMKTLNQILQKEREFVDLLKIDALCDDGRCKDDNNMREFLRRRREEAETVHSEKELVMGLLQICEDLPQHVKVDFKGLDKKLDQNTEMMKLNEFMKVHTLEGQTSPTIGQVTYFNLCDVTRQMASELHAIKDSVIFKVCWKNQVEELSRDQPDTDETEHLDGNEEIYTLDLVYSKVFQSCYSRYRGLYDGLKSGDVLLEEIDNIFKDYKGKYKDLKKDLDIMCRTNSSDNRRWITGRIRQIQLYHDLHLAMESAKIIMSIRNTICPEGDFRVLEKLLQMNQAGFKNNSLNCIDDTIMTTKKILMDITNERSECLQILSCSQTFVLWVKDALKDINELKVFVDLASISAGENDLDVDRVACFHDAVLGYSSILYGLKPDSDFEAFKESLSKLWKALENDRNIPKKLRDTARHLDWLKTVKESHGSVELSSLSLATSINEKGMYTIKAQNQKKLTLETSLMLQISEGPEQNMTCTYEDLKELQNKLMLMSGRGEQNQSEVEHFAEVFDNVQRLAKAFVDLYAAGNPLFSQFKRDFVPQESLERIQKYLSIHYVVPSDSKNALFKGGHSVGIVASRRAGVGKSLYVRRLYEKLEGSVEQGTAFKKCIRLTEHEVDDHKILQSLYDTPKQKDLMVFHFDVTSSVQKGLNEFLFKLLFLRYLMDSDGRMWRTSQKHLYIIELLESTNHQPRYDPGSGRKENFAFSDVFPKDLLLNGVPMGETIARNEALKENFFMMVICVELRIPLFIVGKPGSSKSLSRTLIADAMQGPASHSELYKRLKQIHLVSFQCSPHSTPEGIITTFKQCARFQESKNLDEYISVVVLDEIGLAEDSPKMPLKTLHPLLEEGCVDDEPQPHKRVGFIGISNWALDPAKMNRGIFVSRGDPNKEELIKSAKGICSSEEKVLEKIKHLFGPFAKAYMTVCEEGRGFFGLRDFYSLIKMIFSFTKISNKSPTADEITEAVLRNFSGKDDVDVTSIFNKELKDNFVNASITTFKLVEQSISPARQVDESRYLLILTKNYAALQILQQIFFCQQIHPVIIFGSSFPKDQEYTQICRNINRVKVCMETGQTVVLLNLQNLYESLYDALNQYYVTLGGQKYVDLGLGTHRVKCRVHENFRLIVIEEKEVVYKQFPIPLINRLEKHYLDINTVLINEKKDIARQLQKWVDDFVSLSGQPPMKKQYVPSDVFIGYHSDTCSSVVLQVTENQSDETDAQTILNKAKDILLNCATPDSVVRLDKSRLPDDEREHLMKQYVKEEMHSSLGDYIVYHTQQLEQSHFFFTEVTTFSRLLTAADTQQLQNVIKLDDIKLLSLQQFDTEYSFLKKIREFLGSTPADKVLIIQTDYDEDSRRRNILSSAKYSCINEINKGATTGNTKTFVYFVTKLPRIEGGTSYVGFQGGPWRSVHIDDLRRSKEFVSDVHSLKNLRISELFEDPPDAMETEDNTGVTQKEDSNVSGDLFDISELIRSCVQSAVSMLRDAADSGELSTKRVESLLTLLDESQTQGVFANIVRKRLHSLLEDYEANIPNPKSWVLTEACNVNALQEGGTFLHTLWRKIQAVVTPHLANLVSVIDRDCNVDLLLYECAEPIRNLWFEIFGSKEMLHVPYVRVESDSSVLMVQSHSTGGNTMHCRMPFSWSIKDFLDGLMMHTSRHETHSPRHFQELFLNTPLGSYLDKKVDKKMRKEFFERYLQDFVSMTMKVASDEELQLLCHSLASCVDEIQRRKRDEDELSLPHIHIAYHFYQSRLQNLSRMMSLQPNVVSLLGRNKHILHCPEMVLDVHAAKACVECLESAHLDTDALCQSWLKQVKRLQASLELTCSQHNAKHYGERCKERLNDVSNGWKRIYILSLFVEHMLLGFHNDENQLRTLVLNHIQTLSKVLEEDADVKSMKAFEAVIKVLKSCKQGASDQMFRFGLQCAVCMREPQDPVLLPCHHIYCSTCIRASLDAGQMSCPHCRQPLPNDFQPHVSEDIMISIQKNAEFRRRCNGFFIDLLSTVCFKDNTPPETHVITHLLSYLMVETEHEQIHTKDLSPFDESPDRNPVVRSVILKLLLKFSFDEVREYLQQHLSSIEESRFVDEGDKAELYALYINCLEDSMWEKIPQESDPAKELKLFYNDETQFLRCILAEIPSVQATVSIQHLQQIARLRLSLTMAAQLISHDLSDNNVPDGAEEFLNMVIKFCEDSGNDWYRVYLIRKLSKWQGVESVQTLVKQPKFSWLFPTEIHQQNEDGGQMDQYLVCGEEYKAVRDAVARAVVGGDVQQIEDVCEKCTAPPRKRTLFLLLALFREVTTLYRSANTGLHPTPEQCQAFGELIQGSRYLHQRKVRDFASALVHNKLGALAPTPDHTIVDNNIIELAIHLAAVVLTGTHHLVMPLKHLGLSPENMQVAFIPTMPDDMLAVAQAAIQQDYGMLTWYMCSNNHPCFVDECGLPMQRGRCLECGEEVGGDNHAALSGFRPIQLQQDCTKPGHILGDPAQRNNPDTKNMSLCPFTLVRLVTHLAMLLGASEKSQFVQHIIQPPVEDVHLFLRLHIKKDLDQLSQALGRGADDTVTTVHLVLRSLQELVQASPPGIDPYLTTKASRNTWETTVAADIMTPQLRDLDQLLQEAKGSIRTDSRVSSNFIMRALGDDCTFLTSLPQGSQVHSSAVWSCRERLSLLSLTHIVEQYDQKEELPLLWRFLQKERDFRQIKLLPDILILQKRLVRKFQNATDQIVGSIGEFIEKQKDMRMWYEKHIDIFLKTWNLLRVSVTSNELKIPDEFCSEDLNLNSNLQYLLPRRQGPGLCSTGLVSYLVALQNELVNAVDSHTGDNSSSYKVTVAELTEQHVIRYELEKDLLPLVLSNCQYSLERGHETISQYDLPRIQQQILTRFLQGKPLITRTGIPTLVNTQERDYETIFKAVKGKVYQDSLSSLTRNALSRELDCFNDVCEALKITELLLGFLSMTGGDPMMSLATYLQDILRMANHIDRHILQALGRCHLRHCVSLWQLLSSLKSESMLRLKREPFSGYPAEYLIPLTEEEKIELKGFVSRGNVDQWLLEMHEFLLLSLGRLRAADDYNPSWSVKETVCAYMDRKEVEVPSYVEDKFPENLLLSKIVETWKCAVTAKQDWMMEG